MHAKVHLQIVMPSARCKNLDKNINEIECTDSKQYKFSRSDAKVCTHTSVL